MTDTTTVEPSENAGLLDSVTVEDSSTPEENSQAVQIDHRQREASDPTPGDITERPEYWPENFWDKDANKPDLEGIAKSWRDLRGKISKGAHNAPADGNYDRSAFGEEAENNPMADTLVSWAKENGLSQAQFDDLSSQLQAKAQELVQSEVIDPVVELKQLGPNANAVVNGMVDWARGLVNKGVWSKDDFDEFKIMGGTARGLTALMKIRESYEGRVPIESMPLEGAPSKDELYAMVGDPKYQSDPAYRQKVERMFKTYIPE